VVRGYEIHHGIADVQAGEPFLDGCRVGAVWGTTWHGVLENDDFRRAFLAEVATAAGRSFVGAEVCFEQARQKVFDVLGDLVADHLDTVAIERLIESGTPTGLAFIPPGAPSSQGAHA
jgi:adenosylcobyric acid synthase